MLQPTDASTPWQRVLWLKQPAYPDNHLDHSFLENLQRNVNVRRYSYWGLVLDILPVTQHLCSIMVFVAVFAHLYNDSLAHGTLIALTGISSLLGYIVWDTLVGTANGKSSYLPALFSFLTLTLILLLLSPILQTLSRATTSDSIWPLSASLFGLNAILAEYGMPPSRKDSSTSEKPTRGTLHFPSSLSLNAAISASAVLSSRLTSNLQVFSLMLLSIDLFALLPILRKELRRLRSVTADLSVTILLFSLAGLCLLPLSLSVSALFAATICGLQFGIPLWLLNLQSLKNELKGPWDAAVPKIDGKVASMGMGNNAP